ncbi:unnamed protein product [Cylicocyclus nassatus]|uniref:Uncharacterized protein n=1 Tax=Cylicocyclus nassatus TaxID=53992 RepID=A0AA36GY66_CYLNA|nr:unnamed protein product [Cylicocyclus nassatus]
MPRIGGAAFKASGPFVQAYARWMKDQWSAKLCQTKRNKSSTSVSSKSLEKVEHIQIIQAADSCNFKNASKYFLSS